MGEVIDIFKKNKPSAEDIKILNFADDLDLVIIDAVKNGLSFDIILGTIADRFARTISAIEKQENKAYYYQIITFLDSVYNRSKGDSSDFT
jgi:hypothetical protein